MNNPKTNILSKILKVIGIVFLSVLLVLLILRIVIYSEVLNDNIKDKVLSLASENLNGNIQIGTLEGDLWNQVLLTDVQLSNGDTLATVDTVRVSYMILSLFKSTFKIHEVYISGAKANIIEKEDSTFNVQHYIEAKKTSADTSEVSKSIHVDQFILNNSRIDVVAPSYLPDSSLSVTDLTANAAFKIDDPFYFKLDSLHFKILEGHLSQPIDIYTSAKLKDEIISLQDLVLNTGRSAFSANGTLNMIKGKVDVHAEAAPLSVDDINTYIKKELRPNEIEMSLKLTGRTDSLHLTLEAEGDGFDDFTLSSDFKVSPELKINSVNITAANINAEYFNPKIKATVGEFNFSSVGILQKDFKYSDLTWKLDLQKSTYNAYHIEHFSGIGSLTNGDITGTLNVKEAQSEIVLYPTINNIFSDAPEWDIPIRLKQVDPSYFTENQDQSISISLLAYLKGSGFSPGKSPWQFMILQQPDQSSIPNKWALYFEEAVKKFQSYFPNMDEHDSILIGGQELNELAIFGDLSHDSLFVSGFTRLHQSGIEFGTTLGNIQSDHPTFSYILSTVDFNIADLRGMNEIQTSLNIFASGHGESFDPKNMSMKGTVKLNKGYINGAAVQQISLNYSLQDEILSIEDGKIRSEITSGEFSSTKSISSSITSEDELFLDLELKNLQPLSSYFNTSILQAKGDISGVLRQNGNLKPEFDGDIHLNNIRIDSLFIADEIKGHTTVEIDSIYRYNLDVNIGAPTIAGVTLQDIDLQTLGKLSPDFLNGNLTLQIQSRDAGNILQVIEYKINLNNFASDLKWNALKFKTPARLLSLRSPFNVQYSNKTIHTDTLSLYSESGAFLNLAIPTADSLNQNFWIEGRNFDFGVLQEILFRKRFVDGVLSGKVSAIHKKEFLDANGSLLIRDLSYKEAKIDSLEFGFEVADKRLVAQGKLHVDGEEKINGNLNVPFVLGDPKNFDPSFFNESVQGELIIDPINLKIFKTLLQEYNIQETEGIFAFNGSLKGTAGEPEFNGNIYLGNPVLSGIRVDSAFAQISYDHIDKNVKARAAIQAKGQRAASIVATIPITVDFKTFEILTPDKSDSIHIDVLTEDFNLKVFNDFLPGNYINDLQGYLNADVDILGPIGNLVPEGKISVNKGRVSVPRANIVIDGIGAELKFTPVGLQLQQLKMNSGGGRFNASGSIVLEGLKPVGLDLKANARQFKLANTDDYNMTIDLQSSITGSPIRPELSGKLTVRNGFIYLQDFGERSVEDVQLSGESESSISIYDSLSLDMNFIIDRNFFIRNDRYLDMEVEISGNLEAQKSIGQDLQLFGSLSADEGYAMPLGKRFQVEEGEVTFSGSVTDPAIYLRNSYVPQTSQKEGEPIVLYYIIEGTVSDPIFYFESEPYMEQQDIIAYTLFGRPFYALDSWQQVVSGGGSSPANLLVDVLLDEVEALATRELGIDVVQIDNTRAGSDAVTSVTTGWYLNRRTFFSIVNEISSDPKTLFILEYMLKKNLDLIITQGDDDRQGIDLRWEYEY